MKYDLDLLSISETHLNQEDNLLKDIKVQNDKCNHETYIHLATNKVGMLIRKDLQSFLKKINDKISIAVTPLKEYKLHLIAIYAHTLPWSEENNKLQDTIYETLESV